LKFKAAHITLLRYIVKSESLSTDARWSGWQNFALAITIHALTRVRVVAIVVLVGTVVAVFVAIAGLV
jgi:hypothetical protein